MTHGGLVEQLHKLISAWREEAAHERECDGLRGIDSAADELESILQTIGDESGEREMNALHELDKAVAEACGIELHPHEVYGTFHPVGYWRHTDGVGVEYKLFSPFTDWNDAMLAAEKFGLWEEWCLGYDRETKEYVVGFLDDPVWRPDFCDFRRKGPGCICLAILKLKEAKVTT